MVRKRLQTSDPTYFGDPSRLSCCSRHPTESSTATSGTPPRLYRQTKSRPRLRRWESCVGFTILNSQVEVVRVIKFTRWVASSIVASGHANKASVSSSARLSLAADPAHRPCQQTATQDNRPKTARNKRDVASASTSRTPEARQDEMAWPRCGMAPDASPAAVHPSSCSTDPLSRQDLSGLSFAVDICISRPTIPASS